jgi:hypothetical protein
MARNSPSIGVVATAGRGADDKANGFPFIEFIGEGSIDVPDQKASKYTGRHENWSFLSHNSS